MCVGEVGHFVHTYLLHKLRGMYSNQPMSVGVWSGSMGVCGGMCEEVLYV